MNSLLGSKKNEDGISFYNMVFLFYILSVVRNVLI